MQLIDGIPVWGEPDPSALEQIKRCRKEGVHVALMADHHKGYAVPIGGVVAYQDKVSPSGVGYDIGCGNTATRTGLRMDALTRAEISRLMDEIWATISFGIGQRNQERVESPIFDDPAWKNRVVSPLREMARQQLGTVGSGNHYVDLFHDRDGYVWVGVHFGSRGLGHKVATYFLKAAGASDSMDADPCVIGVNTEMGSDYLECMTLAGAYARAGREWVCQRVCTILGTQGEYWVNNHHNYAWLEEHTGEKLWVVRKGATPAFPGQLGFVGATMAEDSVILEGTEAEEAKYSLCSTVHGAGRVMGRMEAKGKVDRKTGTVIRPGRVSPTDMQTWVQKAEVELRGAGVDESPHCYKRLDAVLAEHAPSIRVLQTLRPIGVAMAGADEFDPYKD